MCAYIQQVSDEMKTIKDMAHDYMCNLILKGFPLNEVDIMAERCFKLAEAMQAEAEKRKAKGEWQPDWSQAPEWADYHLTFDDARGIWLEIKPEINVNTFAVNGKSMKAPSFGYKGDWKDSLRKRP